MRRGVLAVCCLVLWNTIVVSAEPDVFFRQDGGLGRLAGQKLPSDLSLQSALVWEQSLLPGNSTPCIHGDALYVTTWDSDKKQLAIVCLDRMTGRRLWTRDVPSTPIERVHPVGSPASASPACDGERVYAFFGSYGLLCCDLKGNLLWSKALGPFQDEFGAASSPVLLDDLVILNEDHDVDSFVIAINKRTGETVWRQPRGEFTRSYSTPVVWEHGGQKLVVIAGSLKLVAYDPRDGKPVWWVRGLSRIVDTTPVIFDDRLYLATWTPGGDQAERIAMPEFAEGLKLHDKTFERSSCSSCSIQRFEPALERSEGQRVRSEHLSAQV
ncbi:MAG: PQQ-binding-like beta-propeller repeat protein, partial [Planctomycetaceae bacterium]